MTCFRLLAASAALSACAYAAFAETPIPGIDGQWESLSCEVRPQPNPDGSMGEWWLTRALSFADGQIEARFTTYAGPGCEVPVNQLHFAGPVTVLGPSDVMAGAYEADLTIDTFVRITPLAQGFADFLNSGQAGPCGADAWEVGKPQDILQAGCAALSVKPGEATVEYEVLAVSGDLLFFGARPTDGSLLLSPDDRPMALVVPLKRAE